MACILWSSDRHACPARVRIPLPAPLPGSPGLDLACGWQRPRCHSPAALPLCLLCLATHLSPASMTRPPPWRMLGAAAFARAPFFFHLATNKFSFAAVLLR